MKTLHDLSICVRSFISIFSLHYQVVEGNSTTGHRLCPRGFYCPAGTGMDWRACPAGTYSNELGLYQKTQCLDCNGGE